MSRESSQRLLEIRDKRRQTNKYYWVWLLLAFAAIGSAIWIGLHQKVSGNSVKNQPFKDLRTLKELLVLSPADLERCDIAQMNLLCAENLAGSENLRVEECMITLDQWAQHIKAETDRNYYRFKDTPAYYSNSEAFYKMLMMSVVLYEDYNVRYNPKKITSPEATFANDHFFADSRDILIHGLTGPQRMGTCSSMPVLYIALGRRLGYPLKLVKAKGHLFMRWESSTETFDMDATGKGLDKNDDEFYKKWPFPISEADIRAEDYLKSLSAKEELAVFLSIRGECQIDNEQFGDALASFSLAYKLVPTWNGNYVMFDKARQKLARSVIQKQPSQPINPNLPANPTPAMQSKLPRTSYQTQ